MIAAITTTLYVGAGFFAVLALNPLSLFAFARVGYECWTEPEIERLGTT